MMWVLNVLEFVFMSIAGIIYYDFNNWVDAINNIWHLYVKFLLLAIVFMAICMLVSSLCKKDSKIISFLREHVDYAIGLGVAMVLSIMLYAYNLDEEIIRSFPSIYICYISVITALMASLFATLTFFNSTLKSRTDAESNKDGSLDKIVEEIIRKRSETISIICIIGIILMFFLFYGLLKKEINEEVLLKLLIFRISTFGTVAIVIWCIQFFKQNTNIDKLIVDEAETQFSNNIGEIVEDVKGISIRHTDYADYRSNIGKKGISCLFENDFFKLAYYRIIDGLEEKDRNEYCDQNKENDSQLFFKLISQIERYVGIIVCQNVLVGTISKKKYEDSFKWLYTRDAIYDNDNLKKPFHKTQFNIQNERRYKEALLDMAILTCAAGGISYTPKTKYKEICLQYNSALNKEWNEKYKNIENYRLSKENSSLLSAIKRFFEYYEKLINYRNALQWWLLLGNKQDNPIIDTRPPYILAEILHRVFFDKFSSNVKLNQMNMGSSDFSKAWLSYSDLSDSNLHNSSFKFAHLSNSTLKNCDLSLSNFYFAYVKGANFMKSNLCDCLMVGAVLDNCDFSNCRLDGIIFRHSLIDELYKEVLAGETQPLKYSCEELIKLEGEVRNEGEEQLIFDRDGDQFLTDSRKNEIDEYMTSILSSERKWTLGKVVNCCKNSTICQDVSDYIKSQILKKYKDRYQYNEEELPSSCTANASLKQATINNVSLKGVDLSHIAITGTAFNVSVLTEAKFHYTQGTGADFTNANLKKSDFYKTGLDSAIFKNSQLFETVFIDCNCKAATFKASNMANVLIYGEYSKKSLALETDDQNEFKSESNYRDANLSEVEAINLHIYNTNLDKAAMNKSIFKNIHSVNNSFKSANLSELDMTYGYLYANTFYQANVNAGALTDAKILVCAFKQASLEKILLVRSYIKETLFDSTNLNMANFTNAKIERSEFIDCAFDNVNLIDTRIENCNFVNLSMQHVIGITENTFKNCTFNSVKFEKSDRKKIEKKESDNKIINCDEENE